MYNKVQNGILDALLGVCFTDFVSEEEKNLPSDEEISKMYPAPKRVPRKYLRRAKAKKYNLPVALVYLKRVATVCLVVLSVAFGVLITVEGVREEIADTVMTWLDKYTNFDYSKSNVSALPGKNNSEAEENNSEAEENNSDTNADVVLQYIADLNIGYIPEGFELSESIEDTWYREYVYYNEVGDFLFIGIYDSESSETGIDNEDVEYEKLTIDGREIHVFYDEVERTGTVITGNNMYYIAMTGMCEKEELIKIIENIK